MKHCIANCCNHKVMIQRAKVIMRDKIRFVLKCHVIGDSKNFRMKGMNKYESFGLYYHAVSFCQ